MVEIDNWYYIFAFAVTSLAFIFLLQTTSGSQQRFQFIDLIFFLLLIVGLFFTITDSTVLNLNNEYFTTCLTFLSLYFLIRTAPLFLLQRFIPALISLLFFYELFQGYLQLIAALKSHGIPNLLITGNLENSGVYSFYLVINLPLVFYCIHKTRLSFWFKILSIDILLIVVIIILLFTQARTSIITLIAFIALIVFKHSHAKINLLFFRKRLSVLLVTTILFGLIIFYLMSIKADSVNGRILITKVCLQNIKKYCLTGIGIGQFSYYYPLWQINYFSFNHDVPAKYFLNATESHIALNEPLQIFIETGVLGIGIVICLLIYLLKIKTNHQLLSTLKITIILTVIASFTSYPLHCNVILFILMYCTASLIRLNKQPIQARFHNNNIAIIIILIFILFSAFNGFKQVGYISDWRALRNDVFKDSLQTQRGYTNLLLKLQNNGKFFLDMGEQLADIGNASEGVSLLEKSKHTYISYRTLNSTAMAYYQIGNLSKTIENFEMASNLIPSKFTPKLELLNLYLQCHDTTKAKQMSEIILSMPVKKPSPRINEIQNQAKGILLQIEK